MPCTRIVDGCTVTNPDFIMGEDSPGCNYPVRQRHAVNRERIPWALTPDRGSRPGRGDLITPETILQQIIIQLQPITHLTAGRTPHRPSLIRELLRKTINVTDHIALKSRRNLPDRSVIIIVSPRTQ